MSRYDRYQNKQIRNIKKDLRKMKNQEEVKYHEHFESVNPVLQSGNLILLNGVLQGGAQNQREGAQITTTSLKLDIQINSFFVNVSVGANHTRQQIRMLVFWDSQANGAPPLLIGDPFGNVPGVLDTRVTGNPIIAPYMTETNDRFRFLYDKVYTLNATHGFVETVGTPITGIDWYGAPMYFHIKKKFKLGRIAQYMNQNNGIADISKNSLWICFIAEESSITSIDFSSKLFFKDD